MPGGEGSNVDISITRELEWRKSDAGREEKARRDIVNLLEKIVQNGGNFSYDVTIEPHSGGLKTFDKPHIKLHNREKAEALGEIIKAAFEDSRLFRSTSATLYEVSEGNLVLNRGFLDFYEFGPFVRHHLETKLETIKAAAKDVLNQHDASTWAGGHAATDAPKPVVDAAEAEPKTRDPLRGSHGFGK